MLLQSLDTPLQASQPHLSSAAALSSPSPAGPTHDAAQIEPLPSEQEPASEQLSAPSLSGAQPAADATLRACPPLAAQFDLEAARLQRAPVDPGDVQRDREGSETPDEESESDSGSLQSSSQAEVESDSPPESDEDEAFDGVDAR